MCDGRARKVRWIEHSLFLLLIILVLLCVVNGTSASSDASLAISVSLVEGDVFGPGDSFHAIVEIRNREAYGRVDVVVSYDVLNSDENVVLSDSKTVAVETKSSFAEEFSLPVSIGEGTYVFRANVSSLDGSSWSVASRSFSVVCVPEVEQRLIEYVMAAALVLTGGALVYEHRRISKLKVSGGDLKRFIEDKNKK